MNFLSISRPTRPVALTLLLCGAGALLSPLAHAQNAPANFGEGLPLGQVVANSPASWKTNLFFCDGITQISDLNTYAQCGFNTVVVRLTWTPTATGEMSAADLAPQKEFAEAAAKRGLNVIYSLPPAPTGMENDFRISADSDAYISLWSAWTEGAMSAVKDTPNLLGWMLPDDPRGLPIYNEIGLRRYLRTNYASIQLLNERWRTNFDDFDSITLNDINSITSLWKAGLAGTQGNNDDTKDKEQMMSPVDGGSFHPAALALAAYKRDTYAALMDGWVATIRGIDNNQHLVFSGALPDYAQLLTQPDGVDVSLPELSPNVAENDIVTHNPQAIDVARHGGRRRAIPVLSTHGSVDLPTENIPDLTGRWIEVALVRGASGIAFDDWEELKTSRPLREAIQKSLLGQVSPIATAKTPSVSRIYAQVTPKTTKEEPEKKPAEPDTNDQTLNPLDPNALKQAFPSLPISTPTTGWRSKDSGETPVNTTAILLCPLADGATLQIGQNQAARGLYGFGDDLVNGEPSTLAWAMRWGTAFGGVDYLTPDDLNSVDLKRYSTIFAPQLLDCSQQTTSALTSYVQEGGILVADLGIGALQNGGTINGLSGELAQLFGVSNSFDVRPLSFNINAAQDHPLFPTWGKLIGIRPGLSLTLGDGASQSAFDGPAGLFAPTKTAVPLAFGPLFNQKLDVLGNTTEAIRPQLTLNNVGNGAAIFSSFHLWTNWRPGHAGFDGFHGDLMARGAALAIPDAALIPSPVGTSLGSTRFPEVSNRPHSITFLDHDAFNQGSRLCSVDTTGTGDWLWSNSISELSNAGDGILTGGRPAPIDNPTDQEARARPLKLYSSVEPGEIVVCEMRPIAIQNLNGGAVSGQIAKESAREVSLNLWSNVAQMSDATGEWQPVAVDTSKLRVTIVNSDDGYQFAPGSLHQLKVIDYTTMIKGKKGGFKTTVQQVTADQNGRIVVEVPVRVSNVQLTPIATNANNTNRKK